ncbi:MULTISPECIES: TetR/AcrR family transcriptional regulator [Pseudovibrio]|uniref:TetR/AcrR family transcriptional regulator n=1 Tax=Stappiaceae TaxID=2821832 RepID=UPI0023658E43|nr:MULTISPECIES: TetR/AcrR family transcriptional regulator [Pseudovibrio]MDD7911321.1 TetR/AcrR family transcriptional regulator [Pseudovibrio exalbescens]MDX5592992.1 TetR/AcrR family transcriptional regulator [Pseudovibrio sp. SPO723]
MNETQIKIARGLEQAFVQHGFAEPGVDDLKAASGVSLRTLYKYFPSREDMVLGALEFRHQRYLALLTQDLPGSPEAALDPLIDRIAQWMCEEARNGCLFHGAVAAHPDNVKLRRLLETHKREVTGILAEKLDLPTSHEEIAVIHEGLLQAWGLHGKSAAAAAKRLLALMLNVKEAA